MKSTGLLALLLVAALSSSSCTTVGPAASAPAIPAEESSLPPNAVLAKGESAAFDGILVPGPRYARQLQLAVEGTKAREGAYAAPAWQRWTGTLGLMVLASLEAWREIRRR